MNIRIEDKRNHVTADELAAAMQAAAPILARAKAGEEKYADSQGWLKIEEWANEEILANIERIAEQVKKTCDAFVLIGVGGSNNAARSVIEAIADGSGVEIIYAGNTLSAHALTKMLKQLEGKDFAIDCIAKNFETLEPGSSFRILRRVMAAKYSPEEAAKRTICTGTYGSSLEKLCQDEGYTFVPFPTNVGGRYTAMTYVGLLPMACAGIDIRALVKGAADMADRLHAEEADCNIALKYAALRNLYFQKGYVMEMLACFEPRLRPFFRWWTQLFAESEGKDNTGLYPVAVEFSEDLHSVGQFIQDGSPVMFETFIEVKDPEASLIIEPDGRKDYFDYLNGWDFADVNRAAMSATIAAHSEKLPCLILDVEKLDAYAFGQLFYFFQFSVYLSGEILGINPFDQPGVEAYKGWMFKALGK